MREHEGPGVDGLGVAWQFKRRSNLGFFAAALAAGEEELAGEDFVDEGVLVGGRGGGRAQRLEVGDGEGDEVAVEAENKAAQGEGVGAEWGGGGFGGGVVREGGGGGGAEAEVHEDSVSDGGVKWWRGCRRGWWWSGGNGEGRGGEEEEGAAGEWGFGVEVQRWVVVVVVAEEGLRIMGC